MLDKSLELKVLEMVNTFSEGFRKEFAGKITQITALSKRIPLTQTVEQLVLKDLDQLSKRHSETLEIPAQSMTRSDQLIELIEKFKKEKLHLAETIQHDLLGYAESILGTLLDSEYGQCILFELRHRLTAVPSNFINLLELVEKLDVKKAGVSKESLLYFIDIVSGNFEYYEYDKWVKLTSQDLRDVRTQAAILLRSVVKETQKLISELDNSLVERYKDNLAFVKVNSKWIPQKFVERRDQEARDAEIARASTFDTMQYYFLETMKAKRVLDGANNKRKKREAHGAMIRNVSNLKQIMVQHKEHLMILLNDFYFRHKILTSLNSIRPHSNELMQIFLSHLREFLSFENDSSLRDSIYVSVRQIPNVVSYLYKGQYSAEEVLFLSRVLSESLSIPEIQVMKKKDLELYAGNSRKIILLTKFKNPEDRAFLFDCYRAKNEKLDALLLPSVIDCIERNIIVPSQVKLWNSVKIRNIASLLTIVKNQYVGDSERLSRLYDQSRDNFNQVAAHGSLEALERGYSTVAENIAINVDARREVLFSNNALKGYRVQLFKLTDLAQLNIQDIKLLTHSNSLAAMQIGGVKFENLFRILRSDKDMFMYLTSESAKYAYVHKTTFEQRMQQYKIKQKSGHPTCNKRREGYAGIAI